MQTCIEDELFMGLVIEYIFSTIALILSRSGLDSDLVLGYMCKTKEISHAQAEFICESPDS